MSNSSISFRSIAIKSKRCTPIITLFTNLSFSFEGKPFKCPRLTPVVCFAIKQEIPIPLMQRDFAPRTEETSRGRRRRRDRQVRGASDFT